MMKLLTSLFRQFRQIWGVNKWSKILVLLSLFFCFVVYPVTLWQSARQAVNQWWGQATGAPPLVTPATLTTPATGAPPLFPPTTELAVDQGTIFQEAQVVNVVDGDTIDVLLDGMRYRIRYILVDTPETKHPSRGVEPFGPEASEANQLLVGDKMVRLEKDVSETDRYGRLLRYVYVGDIMVNEELLRLGLARVATFPPDVKYVDRFLAIQQQAQAQQVGLWGVPEGTTPPSVTIPTLPPTPILNATTPPPPLATLPPILVQPQADCNCSGNRYNCAHFKTHDAAQACFLYCQSQGRGDVYRLDGNNNGLACEHLD